MYGRLSIVVMSLALATSWADDDAGHAAVMDVIETFFAGMTAKDTEGMREIMTHDGILYGYRDGPDGPDVFRITHTEYLENLASREGVPIERIWNPEVEVRDRIAIAWTPYDFHSDGVFSHCGVNTFSLLKGANGWKITGIVFSVQTDGCEDSPLGPLE